MKKTLMENLGIPHSAIEYIRHKFKGDFLAEARKFRRVNGELNFLVEITKENYLYTLLFNEEGKLLNEQREQAFPPEPVF